jgi:hypothetical protein
MRALIRRFDAFLRWAYGVFEFTDDADCVLRLQLTRARHLVRLPGQVIHPGERVLGLHLWNEHLPPLPPDGPDLAWAIRMQRTFVQSLHAVAVRMTQDLRLSDVRAVGGVTGLLSPGVHPGGVRLMERLGFTVVPYRSPLGRFGEFWENFYSWWIIWTFNAVSLRHRQLVHLQRLEVWMSAGEFLDQYGISNDQKS